MPLELKKLSDLAPLPAPPTPSGNGHKPAEAAASQAAPKVTIKEVGGRRWWLVWLGIALIVVGFIGFIPFMSNQNMVLGAAAIFAILGGGICIYMGLQKQEGGMVITQAGKTEKGKKKVEVKADCLNIYPDRVAFEDTPEYEVGLPRKCHNDNKFYWVNIWDSAWNNQRAQGKLVQFALPDTQYRDTKAFSLNLRIPAHRKLAQRKASLLEKISPLILVVAIVIIGIIWVATSPAPGAK